MVQNTLVKIPIGGGVWVWGGVGGWLMLIFMSILNFEPYFSPKFICTIFVKYLVRPSYESINETIASDRSNRSPLLTISIDNRYCNRFMYLERSIFAVNCSGDSVYNPDNNWKRTCAYRCWPWRYTRKPPVTQSVTRVGSLLLDSSMPFLFHETITSWKIVFTSNHTYFPGQNSIAIDLRIQLT